MEKKEQKHRLDQVRKGLRLLLGEKCKKCGSKREVEIQHPEGCTWTQRSLNSKDRWFRYLKEFKSGTVLELLCRKCAPGKASKKNRQAKVAEPKPRGRPRKVKARTIIAVDGEAAVREVVKNPRSKKLQWVVEVLAFKGHKLENRVACKDLADAERVNTEIHQKLDGRRFFTRVITASPKRMRRALAA